SDRTYPLVKVLMKSLATAKSRTTGSARSSIPTAFSMACARACRKANCLASCGGSTSPATDPAPSAQMHSAACADRAVPGSATRASASTISGRTALSLTDLSSLFIPQGEVRAYEVGPRAQARRLLDVHQLGLVLDLRAHILIDGGQIVFALEEGFEKIVG